MALDLVLLLISVCLCGVTVAIPCPMRGLELCNCSSNIDTTLHIHNVVCTDLKHTTHYALQNLSAAPNVQKLEYTGNNIRELEVNIFGNCPSHKNHLDQLIYIDFSNNHIEVIHGQAFHCVPNVKTLLLNYNEWKVDPSHPRVFSSMPLMQRLELHGAFYTGPANDGTIHLKSVFSGSSMINLEDLHLEENNIEIINSDMFCSLPKLDALFLSSNQLTKLSFRCLNKLHRLYVANNNIQSLTKEDIASLDYMRMLSILDLSNNPFQCTDCSSRTIYFRDWLKQQSRFVVDKYKLRCSGPETVKNVVITDLTDEQLKGTCAASTPKTGSNKKAIITAVILSIIAILTVIFLFVNRRQIKKATSRWIEPIRNSGFMKRMHFGYTTMDNEEKRHVVNPYRDDDEKMDTYHEEINQDETVPVVNSQQSPPPMSGPEIV